MSGIFGYFTNTTYKAPLKADINRMALWNRAYGGQQEECQSDASIHVGCCIEAISDRPLSSPVLKDDICLSVIDSLIYRIESSTPHSESTSAEAAYIQGNISHEEQLLHLIKAEGYTALKRVNGDFAGAVFRKDTNTLTLFRDHMGVRPLYYYADDSIVAFSTDIRGLIALEAVNPAINKKWIYATLGGYFLDGLSSTEYEHIFCINPASYVTFSFQGEKLQVTSNTYWKLGSKKIRLNSFDAYKNKMRKLITDAVQIRLDAVSGTVGGELSGGLDSGVIDILISKLGRKGEFFSWSPDPAEIPLAEEDERFIIEDICKQEGLSCGYRSLSPEDKCDRYIVKNMRQLGIPLPSEGVPALRYILPPYVNTLPLCDTGEYMREHGVKAIFTGHSGDEGVSHRCNPYELFYHREYCHFIKQIWFTTASCKHRIYNTFKKCAKNIFKDSKILKGTFCAPFGAPELLNPDFAKAFSEKDMPPSHFAYSPIEYIAEGGTRNRLDNIAIFGAYNGVRYLAPYVDFRVIDFAVSIPRHLYLNKDQNRYIFREAFHDIMPESMYSLRFKDNNSKKNIPGDPNWFESFAQLKQEVYEKLDRGFWKPYLNFEEIDNFMKQGKPDSEHYRSQNNMLACMLYCAMAQNVIERAREIG